MRILVVYGERSIKMKSTVAKKENTYFLPEILFLGVFVVEALHPPLSFHWLRGLFGAYISLHILFSITHAFRFPSLLFSFHVSLLRSRCRIPAAVYNHRWALWPIPNPTAQARECKHSPPLPLLMGPKGVRKPVISPHRALLRGYGTPLY